MSSHVLAFPRTDRPYKLYTDASKYAVGGILGQDDDNGVERVIQYVSDPLSETQAKWCAMECQAHAIIYLFTEATALFVECNFLHLHRPQTCLCPFQNELANSKVQCWAMILQEYGAPIHYRKGKHTIKADMLSKMKLQQVDVWILQAMLSHNIVLLLATCL